MDCKLFDSELRVMNVLWERGTMTAKEISDLLKQAVGWNQNTTYTVIKKCVAKGAVERKEPGFQCRALVTREQVQGYETDILVDKLFGGSADLLFASLLDRKKLTQEELHRLRAMVEEAQK